MTILLQILHALFGEIIVNLPEFLQKMFSTKRVVEVKSGSLPTEIITNDDLFDNDDIDILLGQ
jgi:hypothetical protein